MNKCYLVYVLLSLCFNSIWCNKSIANKDIFRDSEEASGLAKILYLVSYDFKLMNAYQNYAEKHQNEVTIRCKTCKKKVLDSGYVGSSLFAVTLKDVIDGKNNFTEMKNHMEELLRLLSEGTNTELSEFMLRISSYLSITCTYCESINWEPV